MSVCACVSDSLIFTRKPPFSAIPINGQLIQVRHQAVQTKSDLSSCALSDKRIWLRIRDPNSSKRKLSQSSTRILNMYLKWLKCLPPVRTMWPRVQWQGLCVADAYASGDNCGIGGVVNFPNGQCSWFSVPLHFSDFQQLRIPTHDNLQKDIGCLETLAQLGLVFIATRFFPGSRSPMLSDNTTAESLTNKLRFYLCRSKPFTRNEGRSSKTEEKLRFYLSPSNPFARNEVRSSKTEVKLRFYLSPSNHFARNEG